MKVSNRQLFIMVLFFFSIISIFLQQTSMAEDIEECRTDNLSSIPNTRIVIDPDTGKVIDPLSVNSAKTKNNMQSNEIPIEKFKYQEDGSVRIDFNGKYMIPISGHINSDGSMSLSHKERE